MSTTTDHVRDCAACGWPLGDDCFTGAEATFCRICEDHANQQAIHVGDPVTREEVAVTRGDTTIYFIRYEDDTSYAVCNEYGDSTGHSWQGDIDGIADFIALGDIFDDVEASA